MALLLVGQPECVNLLRSPGRLGVEDGAPGNKRRAQSAVEDAAIVEDEPRAGVEDLAEGLDAAGSEEEDGDDAESLEEPSEGL